MVKKSRFFLALLFVSLSFVLMPATVKAMWDVPVAPGESFRWAFVTSGARDAISPLISDYNVFVNAAATAAGTPITGVVGKSSIADIQWKAIASTFDGTDAIDNIGVSPAGIYTPLGSLVANGTTDMFDGTIASWINITELGGLTPWARVWTGTDPDGTGSGIFRLGSVVGASGRGWPYDTGSGWVSVDDGLASTPRPLYAISEDLRVVPAPSALMLAATSVLSMLGFNRWRRKH